MNWQETYSNLQAMKGIKLRSISGRSDIVLVDVDQTRIVVSTPRGDRSRPVSELSQIAQHMEMNCPVHIDSLLGGSGSSRNQPETIIANMPDVEWLHMDQHKHVVWVGRRTHPPGTIRKMDATGIAKVREQRESQVSAEERTLPTVVVLAHDVRKASEFVRSLFQTPEPKASDDGSAYTFRGHSHEVLLVVEPDWIESAFRLIPLLKIGNIEEATSRILRLFPDASIKRLPHSRNLLLVRLPEGAIIALQPCGW